ncbi:SRPBCC family protein [Microbacterium sp. NPDC055988]|uniref:SRPBCC family protein n=1 Tax=unclassified Microbacterium TaxID=2609290 RepID=UPI00109D7DF0|nr:MULTISPECIES: SRPBCC family protein [unclassified Microbacterium]
MVQIIETIDVDVPVRTAYNQWTQFESFPKFLDEVESITQIDDTHTHWKVKVGGATREFDAEITEQHPDERVAWNSTGGETEHAGVVTFHKLDDTSTRVTVQLDWAPEGLLEKIGSLVGAGGHAVKKDLQNFKEFIEGRGVETGAWRGDVDA